MIFSSLAIAKVIAVRVVGLLLISGTG